MNIKCELCGSDRFVLLFVINVPPPYAVIRPNIHIQCWPRNMDGFIPVLYVLDFFDMRTNMDFILLNRYP